MAKVLDRSLVDDVVEAAPGTRLTIMPGASVEVGEGCITVANATGQRVRYVGDDLVLSPILPVGVPVVAED